MESTEAAPANSGRRRPRPASTRSSRVMKVPARLLIRTGSPPRMHVDELADQDLEGLARVVAEAGGHRAQPADVAVVVGAEHVDAALEAALALVQVVGGVGGEVGGGAVGLDQRPGPCRRRNRWCAARARRRPHRCGPRSRSRSSACVDGPGGGAATARRTRRRSATPKSIERARCSSSICSTPAVRKVSSTTSCGSLGRPGMGPQHAGGDLGDVGAGVAVLRGRLALGGGQLGGARTGRSGRRRR